ncbi:MAG: hypothetical protein JXR51_06305 [Bacteroidales bacterium]|nr:hypothetical protein [Bacteroidales bacterium]
MKQLLLFSAITILLFSCSSKEEEKKSNMLPPLTAEIPDVLKGNKQAEDLIVKGTDLVNQMSETFEELAIDAEPYVGKKEEDLGVMDKINLAKIGVQFMSNMGEFTTKMALMEAEAAKLESGMTEEEKTALETVHENFKKRMEELNEKYKDFGDKNAEAQ